MRQMPTYTVCVVNIEVPVVVMDGHVYQIVGMSGLQGTGSFMRGETMN